jgi:hypothetical protein
MRTAYRRSSDRAISRVRAALAAAVGAGGIVLGGCSGELPVGGNGRPGPLGCTVSCPSLYSGALFNLSCTPTNLVDVTVTGVCATRDAGPSYYVRDDGVWINSLRAGACHVALRFSSGFTYSADVTFTSSTQTGGCCPGTSVSPTKDTFMVNNPSSTCVDEAHGKADVSPPRQARSSTGGASPSPPNLALAFPESGAIWEARLPRGCTNPLPLLPWPESRTGTIWRIFGGAKEGT